MMEMRQNMALRVHAVLFDNAGLVARTAVCSPVSLLLLHYIESTHR
jgi:hypothetical protein